MKQLGVDYRLGPPGTDAPAGIMSRFLPELFLRGAETDISTVSRLQAEWKLLPPGIQDPGILESRPARRRCNFGLKLFQTIPG